MPGQLAEKVRAKYPGVYDDLDDATLERQILAKYPDYQDLAEKAPDQETPKQEKSVSGFLDNLATSGGRFVSDTIQGIGALGKAAYQGARLVNPATSGQAFREMAGTAKGLAQNAPRIVGAVGKAVKDRYGSLDAIGNTLYTDPVGVLGDVSTVAGGGALLAGSRAPKIAKVLSAVESATNPIQLAKPIAKGVEYGTAAAVRPMLKPGKALRRQQTGALEIERTALKEGAVTAGRAAKKGAASKAKATEMAQASTKTVPRDRITDVPESFEEVSKGLEVDSDLAKLGKVQEDATGSLPADVSPAELLDRRRYLDRELNNAFRAQERGGAPTGIKQTAQQEMLGNIRGELRGAVPGIADVDDKTRRLFQVMQAIEDAGLRAGDIPMGAALVGAGGAGLGLPGAGAAGAMFGLGRTFPQIPLALGSVPVRATAAAADAAKIQEARMAALLARLAGGQ